MSKILKFPTTHTNDRGPDPIQLDMQEFKLTQINDMADWVMENISMILSQMGHDRQRFDDKDFIMMYEAIGSAMYRYHDITHPMHELVDEMITFDEDGNLLEDPANDESDDIKTNDIERF